MKYPRTITVVGLIAILLAACGVVDGHLESRSSTINEETDSARNDAILINIVRASRSQPLNFAPISKASGTQTTDLKVGLPTITLGPGQTVAQKQFAFAGNTWDNSVGSSFDTAPLETHDFYQNMLSQVPVSMIDVLIRQGFPRELVFDAMIESVRVTGNGAVMEVRNDPLAEADPTQCPSAASFYGENGVREDAANNIYDPGSAEYGKSAACEYHRFEFFLQKAMAWGINVETKNVANPDYNDAAVQAAKTAGKSPPSKTVAQSSFCFDPAFAVPAEKSRVMTFADRCGAGNPKAENTDLKVAFVTRGGKSAPFTFTIRPRSPTAVFRYFGHLLRVTDENPVRLYWGDAIAQAGDAKILTVSMTYTDACFAKAAYFGQNYCVPYDGADATKQVFAILAQLVALSTATGSLPTTLDVRLQ